MKRQVFGRMHSARKTNNDWADIRCVVLSGGRCAARAEQRNFIKRSRKNGPRIMPTGNLRSGSDSAERDRQRRSMQRLADMANCIRGAVVMVQEAAATGEIQKCEA